MPSYLSSSVFVYSQPGGFGIFSVNCVIKCLMAAKVRVIEDCEGVHPLSVNTVLPHPICYFFVTTSVARLLSNMFCVSLTFHRSRQMNSF